MKWFLAAIFCAFAAVNAQAAEGFKKVENVVPVPPAEQALQTVNAVPIFTAGTDRQTLEGVIFDKNGNLLFCDVSGGKVMRLGADGKAEKILELKGLSPCGLAFHKDGRLFVTSTNLAEGKGAIFALSPDGKKLETILAPEAGYIPNDLVMEKDGGFYFTDFRGSATRPLGGVYYVGADFKEIRPVIPNMAQANGIALSPDGKVLWATEYAANLLHRVILTDSATVPPTGSKTPSRFIGMAPDSMRVDSEGNVYVALVGQGRVLIFNHEGLPIGQILLPGRERGNNLRSTSVAIHPDKNEARIVAGNTAEAAASDAMIFAAPAFAPGLRAPN